MSNHQTFTIITIIAVSLIYCSYIIYTVLPDNPIHITKAACAERTTPSQRWSAHIWLAICLCLGLWVRHIISLGALEQCSRPSVIPFITGSGVSWIMKNSPMSSVWSTNRGCEHSSGWTGRMSEHKFMPLHSKHWKCHTAKSRSQSRFKI